MSIIAGIYSLNKHTPIPDAARESLRNALSRDAGDEVLVFGDERCFLARVDIGAFGGTSNYEDDACNFSLLAGEPLLASADLNERGMEHDLAEIRSGLYLGNFDALGRAQGVFTVADYRADDGTLCLVTDKLGIRPLYYWVGDDFVIFASALRILEAVPIIPKKMNVRAVTEIIGLGYALADRTPYCDVSLLKPGEVLQVKDGEISRTNYFRWDDIKVSTEAEDDLLRELYRLFDNAVKRRLRNDTGTVAYLSGGLDSRCVAAALSTKAANVHTFNFARAGTQDQWFGRQFAEKINTIHTELPKKAGDQVPDYSALLANAWNTSENQITAPAERPQLAWSGEGGSVDLGHVHLGRKIVEFMRSGDTVAAIDEFMRREQVYIPLKLLRPAAVKKVSGVIRQGIGEELATIASPDPARSFYLFLMLNDQRRKLAGHFENLDLHRLEFQLPFFDSSFVEFIVSIPVDMCLEHKLYVRWLKLFNGPVASVPWQAYPGHEPCPLPVPVGMSYQWDDTYQAAERNSLKTSLIRQASELLKAKDFPSDILNKTVIRLAVFAHRTGWRDYGYLIETAAIYYKYWSRCSGGSDLP